MKIRNRFTWLQLYQKQERLYNYFKKGCNRSKFFENQEYVYFIDDILLEYRNSTNVLINLKGLKDE